MAGSVSVTKLIQRRCTGCNTSQPKRVAKKIVKTSAILADKRYWIDFWIFEKTLRPSSTATIMVAKLSSARTMSEAPLETSVPVIPIPIPISAVLSEGASLTPSPVMATTLPSFCQAFTIRTLCSGDTRA